MENKTIQIEDHDGKVILELTIKPVNYDLKVYTYHIRNILRITKKSLFNTACDIELEKLNDGHAE